MSVFQNDPMAAHAAQVERFRLLAGDPGISHEQQELARAWLRRIEAARERFEAPLSVAFLAQVGRGKSTLIAAVTGLRLPEGESPKAWSVLPVGDGRTTLGETRIVLEDRVDIALEVEPVSEEELRLELRLFAEDIWESAQPSRVGHRDPRSTAGQEFHKLLRAWLLPGAPNARDVLRQTAAAARSLDVFHKDLAGRPNFALRCRPRSRSFGNAEPDLRQLKQYLASLMDGTAPDAPAPRAITLRIPRQGLDASIHSLIDTQGLGSQAAGPMILARPDLQALFADPDTLFIVCSEYNDAPDGVALELLKSVGERSDDLRHHGRPLRLLLVDSRGEDTSTASAQNERAEKEAQCRDILATSVPGFSVDDQRVVAVDARREVERLGELLRGLVAEAREERLAHWRTALTQADASTATLRDLERSARYREQVQRLWWAWDAAIEEVAQQHRDPLRVLANLIAQREPWIRHWSHLNAAIRRRGRYKYLDLAEVAAKTTRSLVCAPYTRALDAVFKSATALKRGAVDQEDHAHLCLRQDQFAASVSAHRRDLEEAWVQIIRRYFASSPADALWEDCKARWGMGPGYVADVALRFEQEAERVSLRLAPGAAPPPPEEGFPPRPVLFCLREVGLRNFRGFVEQRTTLDSTTVFVGDNGQGKTAWLEAIAAGIGALLPGMKAGDAPALLSNDIRQVVGRIGDKADRQAQIPLELTFSAEILGHTVAWRRSMSDPRSEDAPVADDPLRVLAQRFGAEVRSHAQIQLPVLCFYGTQRLWPPDLEANQQRPDTGGRLDGYRDALKAASTHRHLLDWMWKHTLVELQSKEPLPQLRAIQQAVVACVEGARGFHYDIDLAALCLTMEDGAVLPFNLLSDGYRNIVAMVADIAWRAAVLNPQLRERAPALAEGIVLIDEVDLHLHPTWQRRVLSDLRRAFPRMQFIVSTHSPQVIASADPGWIRVLRMDDEVGRVEHSRGVDSNTLLREVFGDDERPQETVLRIGEIRRLVAEGDLGVASSRLDELERDLGGMAAVVRALRWEIAESESGEG